MCRCTVVKMAGCKKWFVKLLLFHLVKVRLPFHIGSLVTFHASSDTFSFRSSALYMYATVVYTVKSQSHLFTEYRKENVNDDTWKVTSEPHGKAGSLLNFLEHTEWFGPNRVILAGLSKWPWWRVSASKGRKIVYTITYGQIARQSNVFVSYLKCQVPDEKAVCSIS